MLNTVENTFLILSEFLKEIIQHVNLRQVSKKSGDYFCQRRPLNAKMSPNLVYTLSQPNFFLEDRTKKVKQFSLTSKILKNNVVKLFKNMKSHKNYMNGELNFSAVIMQQICRFPLTKKWLVYKECLRYCFMLLVSLTELNLRNRK